MYKFSHLITYSYWFANSPEIGRFALWAHGIAYAALVAAYFGIEYWILKMKPDRFLARVLRKFKTLAMTMGVTGFVLLFFRIEFIPFFSRRLVYLIWIAAGAFWAGFLALEFRALPKRRKDAEEIDRIKKYLPH